VLVGHVLGDFYLQSDAMAHSKGVDHRAMTGHCLAYAACMAAASLVAFSGWRWVAAAFALAVSHALIDACKSRIGRELGKTSACFIVDQALHLIVCVIVVLSFRDGQETVPLASAAGVLMGVDAAAETLMVLLTCLIVLKPADLLVRMALADLRLVEVDGSVEGDAHGKPHARAGWLIGRLERLIIVAFVLAGQYTAVAFVLTAKSVARFKRLEDEDFSEIYLVGTLSSAAIAIIVPLVLTQIVRW
jgi:hypothetical protein